MEKKRERVFELDRLIGDRERTCLPYKDASITSAYELLFNKIYGRSVPYEDRLKAQSKSREMKMANRVWIVSDETLTIWREERTALKKEIREMGGVAAKRSKVEITDTPCVDGIIPCLLCSENEAVVRCHPCGHQDVCIGCMKKRRRDGTSECAVCGEYMKTFSVEFTF
jgi:transcription elongation factor Elf1